MRIRCAFLTVKLTKTATEQDKHDLIGYRLCDNQYLVSYSALQNVSYFCVFTHCLLVYIRGTHYLIFK